VTQETSMATLNGLPEALRRPGYPRDAVEALSSLRDEPAWLRERRLFAWLVAEGTPWPTTKDEQWRHTDILALGVETYAPYAPGRHVDSAAELPAPIREALDDDMERAGVLVQHNSDVAYHQVNENLGAQGIVFMDLERAAREHPDLVQANLGSVVSERDGRMAALNMALWTGGIFVYVPANAQVTLPLHAFTWVDQDGVSIFPRNLIVAGPNSTVTLVDEGRSPDAVTAMVQGVTEIVVGQNAHVNYVLLQQWGAGMTHITKQRTQLERDSTIINHSIALGGKILKASLETSLTGINAHAELSGVAFGEGDQRFDFDTVQSHVGEHSVSDLKFKAALKDRSQSVYWGLIEIKKSARGTDANQENRNLLLSDKARADSTPVLEIELFDIERCSHGATVGPVDEDQLYYLQSRGIAYQDALNLLIEGFFAQIIERVPVEALREPLMDEIRAKLNR
jgi:Fe-S cluster assembly protein SufD